MKPDMSFVYHFLFLWLLLAATSGLTPQTLINLSLSVCVSRSQISQTEQKSAKKKQSCLAVPTPFPGGILLIGIYTITIFLSTRHEDLACDGHLFSGFTVAVWVNMVGRLVTSIRTSLYWSLSDCSQLILFLFLLFLLTFKRRDLEALLFFFMSGSVITLSRSLSEQVTVHIACPLLLAGRSPRHSLT